MNKNNITIPIIDKSPLEYVLEKKIVEDGVWCEFGVFRGVTINHISSMTNNIVYGFDSFEGLPDNWDVGNGSNKEKGFYSYTDYAKENKIPSTIPQVNENVRLYKGWFNETVPKFKEEITEPITFIHMDCDIYSSTIEVLNILGTRIKNNTIIVFDEFINYPNYKEHEFKAFHEWVENNNVLFEYIGTSSEWVESPEFIMSKDAQKVAVRIINNPIFT